MCIGVPMRVIESRGGVALCERRGERVCLAAMLLGDIAPGTFVLAFQGSAVREMTPEEAAQTDDALDALAAAMQGESDFGRHFADLLDREPALPAHLRKGT